LPLELEDAARIDGASSFAIYWRILLPLSGSALAALGIFTFLGQWNNLFWPLIVTTENSMRTLPVGLSYFRGQYGTQWNLLMAGTTIALLPVLLVFIAGQRFFVQGIAFSGMGGR
jgi:multiple sugar transport system permease protein